MIAKLLSWFWFQPIVPVWRALHHLPVNRNVVSLEDYRKRA